MLFSPFLCLQENPACGIDEVNGAGGDEYMMWVEEFLHYVLIPDSHIILLTVLHTVENKHYLAKRIPYFHLVVMNSIINFNRKFKTKEMGNFGATEIILILLVVVLLFGGRKIPELMKGIGQGMKEFKKASNVEDEPEKTNTETKVTKEK